MQKKKLKIAVIGPFEPSHFEAHTISGIIAQVAGENILSEVFQPYSGSRQAPFIVAAERVAKEFGVRLNHGGGSGKTDERSTKLRFAYMLHATDMVFIVGNGELSKSFQRFVAMAKTMNKYIFHVGGV